jgi:hypothetical protein
MTRQYAVCYAVSHNPAPDLPACINAVVLRMGPGHPSPAAQAERAVAEARTKPTGHQVLYADWFLERYLRTTAFHGGTLPLNTTPIDLIDRGIPTAETVEWLRPLSDLSRKMRVDWEYLFADVEHMLGPNGGWPDGAEAEYLSRLASLPHVMARMEETHGTLAMWLGAAAEQRAFESFSQWRSDGRMLIAHMMEFCNLYRLDAFRRIVMESGLFRTTAGNLNTRFANWEMTHPDVNRYDANYWRFPRGTTSRVSMPAIYLSEKGVALAYTGLDQQTRRRKCRLWNSWIMGRNTVRKLQRASSGTVVPIYSDPMFVTMANGVETYHGNDGVAWLNMQGIIHDQRAGIKRSLVWFANAATAQEAAATVNRALTRHNADYQRPHLPDIPLDADEVTTNGHTTTYRAFCDMAGCDGEDWVLGTGATV